jgi:DedD protein
MPPELPNNQELSLKKRARRRLVGAVGLVLLMVIVLPMVLQDRASLAPQDAIKITMPEVRENVVDTKTEAPLAIDQSADALVVAADEGVDSNMKSDGDEKSVANTDAASKPEKKVEVKDKAVATVDSKLTAVKPTEARAETKVEVKPKVEAKAEQKDNESFTIQVGVFSDAANVKQLQAKLKEAGYTSHTEKIATAKGEKIRLRAGNYSSRQAAASALAKLQAAGLTGMVISNE